MTVEEILNDKDAIIFTSRSGFCNLNEHGIGGQYQKGIQVIWSADFKKGNIKGNLDLLRKLLNEGVSE